MSDELTYEQGKQRFIELWGSIGSTWGINRTMGMIHALLLISPEPLSAEDIMKELNISRGNANMNIRALIDWSLVHKHFKSGERREYFSAEKDMFTIIKAVVVERKKRELEPMLKVLDQLSQVEGNTKEEQEFARMVKEIKLFSNKSDSALDSLVGSNAEWLVNTILKLSK